MLTCQEVFSAVKSESTSRGLLIAEQVTVIVPDKFERKTARSEQI